MQKVVDLLTQRKERLDAIQFLVKASGRKLQRAELETLSQQILNHPELTEFLASKINRDGLLTLKYVDVFDVWVLNLFSHCENRQLLTSWIIDMKLAPEVRTWFNSRDMAVDMTYISKLLLG